MNLARITSLIVQSTSYERIFLFLLTHRHNSNDIRAFLVTGIASLAIWWSRDSEFTSPGGYRQCYGTSYEHTRQEIKLSELYRRTHLCLDNRFRHIWESGNAYSAPNRLRYRGVT